MIQLLDLAKSWLIKTAVEDGIYADFTMGNGNDTLFLTQLAPRGKVYAFDVQEKALENTARRLEEAGVRERATLIYDSHSNLDQYIREPLDGGMFNLGYLPQSDKVVTTRRETTLKAVEKALRLLKRGRFLIIMVYPGHEEGTLEGEALQAYLAQLPGTKADVFVYRLINAPDAPYIIGVYKRKDL